MWRELPFSYQSLHDPTVKGLSRFFYGYALWRDGQRKAAVEQWEFSVEGDSCTSVMALCKEPSKEQHAYLRILIDERVKMNGYDGQSYSALDYAVFSGDEETEDLILQGLARTNNPSEIKELQGGSSSQTIPEHFPGDFPKGIDERAFRLHCDYAESVCEDA